MAQIPLPPPWVDIDMEVSPKEDPPKPGHDPVTGRWLPGHSGNPKGRPAGRWSNRLHSMVPKALAAIEKALDDGDMSAVGHLLSRTVPALKAESPEVEFEFDPNGSAADMSAAILTAVSKGQLTVEAAKLMQEMISAHVGIRDVETFMAELRKVKDARGHQPIPGGVKVVP